MQSPPASDTVRSPDRYVVRLSGALAALLGRAEGAELPEDELLGRLREWGLITYPSPLLAPLIVEWPDVLAAGVLPWLDPTDLAMLGRVDEASRAAVVASGLPRAGATEGELLKVVDFVGSAQRLAWARHNGCPWVARTCAFAAEGGRVEVLRWAREHGCPWMEAADEDDGDFVMNCCACAARNGHLEVLQWLREQDCSCDAWTCAFAAEGGHLELMQWAREHGAPWDEDYVRALAAEGGHQDKLARWRTEHGDP
jgi:hypothetical protein